MQVVSFMFYLLLRLSP